MILWTKWFEIASQLRQACSRNTTFMWLLSVLMAMSVRDDRLGVTSFIRALGLKGKYYSRLLDFFHSTAIDLDCLTKLWVNIVLRSFQGIVRLNGRLLLIGDGIKAAKAGKKMPGVKTLHQESENNTKPEYILGHSCQAITILSSVLNTYFAVPLISRIHEGVIFDKNNHLTLLDKMILLLDSLGLQESYYFIADKYYASGKIVKGLLAKGNHLITTVKLSAIAYEPYIAHNPKKGPGRHRIYGTRVPLKYAFNFPEKFDEIDSPAYGEKNVKLKVHSRKLLWKASGTKCLFVFVMHPTRGNMIGMSTDLTINPIDVIKSYSLRYKIEYCFKQSLHTIGTYAYRFWMKMMKRTKRGDLDAKIYKESDQYQKSVRRKIRAYHLHIQLGLIAQGLLQYLSSEIPKTVWQCFGSWLRTIREGIPPSEFVTSVALRNSIAEFLIDKLTAPTLKKFLYEKIDFGRVLGMRLAA